MTEVSPRRTVSNSRLLRGGSTIPIKFGKPNAPNSPVRAAQRAPWNIVTINDLMDQKQLGSGRECSIPSPGGSPEHMLSLSGKVQRFNEELQHMRHAPHTVPLHFKLEHDYRRARSTFKVVRERGYIPSKDYMSFVNQTTRRMPRRNVRKVPVGSITNRQHPQMVSEGSTMAVSSHLSPRALGDLSNTEVSMIPRRNTAPARVQTSLPSDYPTIVSPRPYPPIPRALTDIHSSFQKTTRCRQSASPPPFLKYVRAKAEMEGKPLTRAHTHFGYRATADKINSEQTLIRELSFKLKIPEMHSRPTPRLKYSHGGDAKKEPTAIATGL